MANTVAEQQLVANIKKLNDTMTAAENEKPIPPETMIAPVKVEREALELLFTEGENSIKKATSPYYSGQIEGDTGLLAQYAAVSNDERFAAGMQGGLWNTYIFNANGLDLRQQVDKGLMSAAQYKHMAELSLKTGITPADIDRMLAVMGGNPAFPANVTDEMSVAKYAVRRSVLTDPNSVYNQIKEGSLKARAASANPTVCAAELSAALTQIRKAWEKTLVTTTLFYANDAKSKLAQTGPAQKESGLHSIGEGFAFVHGFKALDQKLRTISDEDIDVILRALGNMEAGTPVSGATATPHKYLEGIADLAPLDAVVTKIKDFYGLSEAEVASLKQNQNPAPPQP